MYSYWAPLDGRFTEMAVRLAQVKGFDFVTPFWTRYFFAYLDYDEFAAEPRDRAVAQIMGDAVQNMIDGVYTSTGQRYMAAIAAAKASAAAGR
jgi:hypothetical protein